MWDKAISIRSVIVTGRTKDKFCSAFFIESADICHKDDAILISVTVSYNVLKGDDGYPLCGCVKR